MVSEVDALVGPQQQEGEGLRELLRRLPDALQKRTITMMRAEASLPEYDAWHRGLDVDGDRHDRAKSYDIRAEWAHGTNRIIDTAREIALEVMEDSEYGEAERTILFGAYWDIAEHIEREDDLSRHFLSRSDRPTDIIRGVVEGALADIDVATELLSNVDHGEPLQIIERGIGDKATWKYSGVVLPKNNGPKTPTTWYLQRPSIDEQGIVDKGYLYFRAALLEGDMSEQYGFGNADSSRGWGGFENSYSQGYANWKVIVGGAISPDTSDWHDNDIGVLHLGAREGRFTSPLTFAHGSEAMSNMLADLSRDDRLQYLTTCMKYGIDLPENVSVGFEDDPEYQARLAAQVVAALLVETRYDDEIGIDGQVEVSPATLLTGDDIDRAWKANHVTHQDTFPYLYRIVKAYGIPQSQLQNTLTAWVLGAEAKHIENPKDRNYPSTDTYKPAIKMVEESIRRLYETQEGREVT